MKRALVRIVISAVLAVSIPAPAGAGSWKAPASGPPTHRAPNFNTPAAALRAALDVGLAEHAFLMGEAMRAGLRMDADFDAVGVSLEANSDHLAAMVGDVYGADAATAFGELWRSHVAYLIDYTRALATDDDAARQLADHQLHTYVQEFSAFLASANPNLPQDVVAELVNEHVQQLEGIAAFDQGRYEEAYPAIHRTYNHMFTIGDALSEAIALQFPDRFSGKSVAFSPAGDLRIALDRLLGEHTALAVTAMRASVARAGDEEAAASALDRNTRAIGSWVRSVYGRAAADSFTRLWTSHTDAYLGYVDALTSGDEAGQQTALDRLADYRSDFSRFLARANPELSASALRGLLRRHTNQLIEQTDAYVAGDYSRAYELARETFHHATGMADALALAIAAQFPDKFPDTQTSEPASRPTPWLALTIAFAIMLLFVAMSHLAQRSFRRRMT
jgi:hypothetical protein